MVKRCKPATQTPGERLGFLLAAAAWQDSLLQAYRTMLLTSQALLLAIGSGLFVAELAMKSRVQVFVVSGVVVLVALGGSLANWQGRTPNNPRQAALLEKLPIADLTPAGLGYTRKVIDRELAYSLLGGWGVLALGAIGYTVAVAISGVP